MSEGPHCPKCGSHSEWQPYANGDALMCGAQLCGYIHWLRNAPSEAATALEANTRERNAARLAQQQVTARRKRIRKLVHSLLLSPTSRQGSADGVVTQAAKIDADIEAIL